ncbi:MAG: Zn-dependent hydrolase [Acetobacterales bacterium]
MNTDTANIQPDVDLAKELFDKLREATFDGVGITRDTFGEGEQKAHDIVTAAAKGLGLEIETDFAGNLYLRLPGADRKAKQLLLGSHLDSVPQGGNYDGAAGVLAGLAVVAGLKRAGVTPARDITVIVVRGEESAWFPYSYIGSRCALGLIPPEVVDEVKRSDSGVSLGEQMRKGGWDPDAVKAGRKHVTPENTAGYIEVHIEQGPVLLSEGLPVAVVTGVRGSSRRRSAKIAGEYSHSGAVPRKYRKDAAAAFAEFAYRVDRRWIEIDEAGGDLVVTFCTLGTNPKRHAFSIIPGEVSFSLDMRSTSRETLDEMDAFIAKLVPELEEKRGVTFDLGPYTDTPAPGMDDGLRKGLARAAESAGVKFREMASGGGHDAVAFNQAGIPAAMLFVRNEHGSHNPDEHMEIADFAEVCRVLMTYVRAEA